MRFASAAIYELKIDTDGDAVADIAYRVRFTSSEGGAQTATLLRVEGAQAAGTGDDGQVIVEGAAVSTGPETRVTEAGDYRFFAGWRGDPFYFDVQGALNNLRFTGDDFFADKDVCSTKPVPLPPPGFDELSVDEKIDYLQSLWDRIAATPKTVPVPTGTAKSSTND
jgi:Domain of unknown function (DUF4331)